MRVLPRLWLAVVGFALVLATLYLALLWLGPARFFVAPNAQRIFYLHVPVALVTYVAFLHTVGGSLAYLRSGSERGDQLARCAAELGLLFGALTLISGVFWMRAEWGSDIAMRFLTDMRLATTLFMWLIYVAYVVIRNQAGQHEVRQAAALVGSLGLVAVPLSYLSSRLLPSEHPVVVASDEGSLAPAMRLTLLIGLAAFMLLFVYLLRERLELEQMRARLLTARLEAEE